MKIEHEKGLEAGEFVAYSDGERMGEVNYRFKDSNPKLIYVTHVGIEPKFRGGGNASKMFKSVVESVRKEGVKIIPICPFAKLVFSRDESVRDVLSDDYDE